MCRRVKSQHCRKYLRTEYTFNCQFLVQNMSPKLNWLYYWGLAAYIKLVGERSSEKFNLTQFYLYHTNTEELCTTLSNFLPCIWKLITREVFVVGCGLKKISLREHNAFYISRCRDEFPFCICDVDVLLLCFCDRCSTSNNTMDKFWKFDSCKYSFLNFYLSPLQ